MGMRYRTVLIAAAILLGLCASAKATPPAAPNIVFILTDDQGYGDVSCNGARDIKTPNIDRLCKEGMRFDSFYVHQRCSPTRLAFMTGSYAVRTGCNKVIYARERMGINDGEVTVAELLKKAGYTTGIVGKWHMGEWEPFHPLNHGFDYFHGFMNTEGVDCRYENHTIVERGVSKTKSLQGKHIVQAGVDFLRKHKDDPFFLYFAHTMPHTHLEPGEEFVGTSKRGIYGDVIHEIDWGVGQLLDTLKELGLEENTLVIFTSDNGPVLKGEAGSAGPYRDGKWSDFEGGVRMPTFMRWPGVIEAGSRNNEITGIVDLLPTFCEIAGVTPPETPKRDGLSILPYLRGEQLDKPIRDTQYWPSTDHMSAIRYQDWKFFPRGQKAGGQSAPGAMKAKKNRKKKAPVEAPAPRRPDAASGALFNLRDDPGETKDVSTQHPEIVEKLTRMSEEFMVELLKTQRRIGRLEGSDL